MVSARTMPPAQRRTVAYAMGIHTWLTEKELVARIDAWPEVWRG